MSERVFAVLGLYDSPDALLQAIPMVRAKGLGPVEAYTPYPLHGLDAALSAKRSPLGGMVLVMGVLGAAIAFVLQWWTSAFDYPIVTGGKALFSWEAFVPVMFEVMVGFATFTAGLGMLFLLNRLPSFSHPMLATSAMASLTRDRFGLCIEAGAAGELDVVASRSALEASGAREIEVVLLPEPPPTLSAKVIGRLLGAIAAACLISGLLMYWAVKLFPVLPPMVRMHEQPKVVPQSASAFFPDGRGQRLPAPGAVARGHLPYDVLTPDHADLLANPLPRTREILARGRARYQTYCTVCHGPLGTGVGTLTQAYGATPANLQASSIRASTDGRIYDVIVRGKNAMPSYAADLSEDERWAVVHYLRALQRAQNATDEDLR